MQRGYADTLPPLFRYVKTFLSSFVDSIRISGCSFFTLARQARFIGRFFLLPHTHSLLRILLLHLHLAVLAIELQTETPSVVRHQRVRFLIGRTLPLMNGTPAHAVTQAMLAEHKHGIFHRFFLVGRPYALHSVLFIERSGTRVHHISQIRERCLRKGVGGLLPHSHFPAVKYHSAELRDERIVNISKEEAGGAR